MAATTWQPIGSISPGTLDEARRQAHNAVHWVARLAHSYLAAEPGNTHVDLIRDARDGALVTRGVGEGLSVGVDVAELTLQFREHGARSQHRLRLDGRSAAAVEAWFLVELLHRHCDRDRFSKVLPYDTADLMTGDVEEYAQERLAAELAELARWQSNAAAVLQQVSGGIGQIQCSPRHFDIAVVLPVEGAPGAVRAGFAPGDERLPEPYFYIATHAWLDAAAPAGMPRIGRLQTRDLVVDVLPSSEIVAADAGAEPVLKFLSAGITAARRRLSN